MDNGFGLLDGRLDINVELVEAFCHSLSVGNVGKPLPLYEVEIDCRRIELNELDIQGGKGIVRPEFISSINSGLTIPFLPQCPVHSSYNFICLYYSTSNPQNGKGLPTSSTDIEDIEIVYVIIIKKWLAKRLVETNIHDTWLFLPRCVDCAGVGKNAESQLAFSQ